MLRHPASILYEHPLQTLSAILSVSFCLLFPFALSLVILVADNTTVQYYEMYEPTVYIRNDISEPQQNALINELKSLPAVNSVEVRKQTEAYSDLISELSLDDQNQLDLEAAAFPKSLRIKLKTFSEGYNKTFTSIKKLPEKSEVIDVDVPNPDALSLLNTTQYFVIVALIFSIIAIIVAYTTFHFLLLGFLKTEETENQLLFAFGAPPDSIRRPTITRGLVLGLVSGVVVTFIFGAILAVWYANAPLILGRAAILSVWSWPLVVTPLISTTILGFVAGLIVSRTSLGFPFDGNIKLAK